MAKNKEESASDRTNDLDTISKQAHDWDLSFNPDPKKHAQEVLFSTKNSNMAHAVIYFNNVQVQRANQQKRLLCIKFYMINFIDKVLTKTSKDFSKLFTA